MGKRGVERMKCTGVLSMIILLLLMLQVFSALSYGSDTQLRGEELVNLQGERVYTTHNTITDLSVYGSRIAWSEYIQSGDYNIVGYVKGSGVRNIANSPRYETVPRVGTEVVWVDSFNGTARIDSTVGYLGPPGSNIPAVDGNRVAFVVYSSQDYEIYYGEFNSNMRRVSLADADISSPSSIDISRDYIVVNNYLYSISHAKFSKYYQYWAYGRISGHWLLYTYRSNFGKSQVIVIRNLETGRERIVASYDLGSYEYVRYMDIDGYGAVWMAQGVAYYYDVLSEELRVINAPDVQIVAIGNGKIAWMSYSDGEYGVWYASVPKQESYVEFTLEDLDDGHDVEYHTLMIVDSQGRRLGGMDGHGDIYREIPGAVVISAYGRVKSYRISSDNPSEFRTQVIGGHDGRYTLRIKLLSPTETRGSGSYQFWVNATNMPIKKEEINEFIVNWEKVISGAAKSVLLKIDGNGDGSFESQFELSTSITPEDLGGGAGSDGAFTFQLQGLPCFLALFLMFVVLIFLIVRRKKR